MRERPNMEVPKAGGWGTGIAGSENNVVGSCLHEVENMGVVKPGREVCASETGSTANGSVEWIKRHRLPYGQVPEEKKVLQISVLYLG